MTLTAEQREQLRALARDEAAQQSLVTLVEELLADAHAREQAYAQVVLRDWEVAFTIDSESGAILDVSGAVEAFYGYSRDEVLRMNHTDFSAEPSETRRAVSEQKTTIPVRYHRRKDGTVMAVEIAGVHFIQRGRNVHLAAIRSHAAREKVEIALLESEERYRRLVELLPSGVLLHHQGKILLANGAAARILKADHPGELVGQSGLHFLHPDYRALTLEHLERLATTAQPALVSVEEKVVRRDGVTIDVALSAVPFPYQGETAMMIVFEDMTEHKRAQRQAFDLAVERERLNILRKFVQDTSHEFRTPLSIINNSLYLYTRAGSAEKEKAYSQAIRDQVQRLSRLLDDMVTMSRLDSVARFQLVPVALNPLLQSLVSRFAQTPDTPRLTLETDDHLPLILGDEDLLRRALGSLLSNALRFTPASGSIQVRTLSGPEAVEIEIRDTGIGMTADTMQHIFERFYREDEARTTPGLGLGLPIAWQVIEGHGGHIEVESAPGEGSLFRVWLPCMPPAN